jgi:cytochrome P450
MQQFRVFAQGALKQRFGMAADLGKNGQEERKDFVHYLSQAKDPETGKGYQQMEMLVELRLLIVAGSDTSSVIMAAAFYYLTRNQGALEKLQRELRSTFDNVDDIVTGPKISSCHYLRAVIDECLRLSPPVGSSLPREIMEGGMTVDGIALPAGTNVGSGAFALHRNEEYFSNPLTFKPERWLPEHTPAEEITHAKTAFCPFSLGNRGCIGKPMAYNELSIALGRVFWLYDVRLSPGDKTGQDANGLYDLGDIFVAERNGPMVEFRKYVRA